MRPLDDPATTRRCASCGTVNPSDSDFCLACGQHLTLACRHCGAGVPPAARFCTRSRSTRR
ncbi:MAG: zinc ribbon domain-containing protein [Candidatus Binatia bacterium]